MIFAHFERKKNGYIVEPRSEGTIKDPEKDMTFLNKYFKGFKVSFVFYDRGIHKLCYVDRILRIFEPNKTIFYYI